VKGLGEGAKGRAKLITAPFRKEDVDSTVEDVDGDVEDTGPICKKQRVA
jgi:hypothetical protein